MNKEYLKRENYFELKKKNRFYTIAVSEVKSHQFPAFARRTNSHGTQKWVRMSSKMEHLSL